ncbi:MAG TPA: hypothetical protein VM120_21540 [Bryobacteraceae bacterium]|nr:hypothetical protein [Bryobacteraceae bacterium]
MQPVQTLYGGAHRFRHDTAGKLGRHAVRVLEDHHGLLAAGPDLLTRVRAKLQKAAIEDFRIDFEDGYGCRSDDEEDTHAVMAAKEVAQGVKAGTLPQFLGIRCKPFSEQSRTRSLRTLRLFFEAAGELPRNFTVTLPKVTAEEQVSSLCQALVKLDRAVSVELMVETPEALRNLRSLVAAAGPRCRGAHFGPYDFTSSCGVMAGSQGLRHPLCTHARNQMVIELAGTGVWLSDGPTSVLPIGAAEQISLAWKTQWDDIRHALSTGFYQGWDLHPAQLPVRYAAIFSFFLDSLPLVSSRLKNFIAQSAQATRIGGTFDDAATAQGLRIFFLRALGCGAITEAELREHSGLSAAELEQLRF